MKVDQIRRPGNLTKKFLKLSLSIGVLAVFFTGCIHVHKETVEEKPVVAPATAP